MYRWAIVDGGYLTRRAYEAAGKGACIAATVGKLVALAKMDDIQRVAIAWDQRGPHSGGRRWAIHNGYKAKRSAPPKEYTDACAELKECLHWLDIHQIKGDGEADDIAWTVCRQWRGPILLWSADKDWLPFLSSKADLLRPFTGRRPKDIPPEQWRKPDDQLITYSSCKELTGLSPAGWFSCLTIAGDPVDGIPGLPGIGKKRATDIISACPDLVPLVLHGEHDAARSKILANDPSMMRWVELAIEKVDDLAKSASLVRPYEIDITTSPGRPPTDALEFEAAKGWLEGHGLAGLVPYLGSIFLDESDLF